MIEGTYPVHERFYTFQGEGDHMGKPAFFIRLFGCPVHCPWCDSAGTWHPKWIPQEIPRMTPEQLFQEAMVSQDLVVVTGGEPAVHDLIPLSDRFRGPRFSLHIETSGAFPIRGAFTWITLSPKKLKLPIEENVDRADEFKIIVESKEDIAFYYDTLMTLGMRPFKKSIWLHPEWSHRADKEVLLAISQAVKQSDGIFRAGWQIHKEYMVDGIDLRSRPLVPLGGDPARGL